MADATNSVHLAQLGSRLHHVTYTIALQAALNITKHKLRAQGLKLSQFRACDLRVRAEQYLSEHREELLADAKLTVEQWRLRGFFGKRAQCANLLRPAQRPGP